MSTTIRHGDKLGFTLDICDWYSERGLLCWMIPTSTEPDKITLSMTSFDSSSLLWIKMIANSYGLKVYGWECQGEFSGDRFFTVNIFITQIRRNGRDS